MLRFPDWLRPPPTSSSSLAEKQVTGKTEHLTKTVVRTTHRTAATKRNHRLVQLNRQWRNSTKPQCFPFPQCGYTAGENRRGDRFECKHCCHKAQADQNGALNLLLRVNDPEYRRYMTKEAVKKLERGRYEAWCKSRQEEPIKESVNRKRLRKAA